MSTDVHPLTEWFLSEKHGRRPEVLVIRRGLLVRFGQATLALFFAISIGYVLAADCAEGRRILTCYAFQWTWPIWICVLGYLGMFGVTRLFDRRPCLVLDKRGIRFPWAGTIPWSEIESASVPQELAGKRGGNRQLHVHLKDKKRFLEATMHDGNIVRKLLVALYRSPYSFLLPAPFGYIILMGTGLCSYHLVDWINEHVSDEASPADVDRVDNRGIVTG